MPDKTVIKGICVCPGYIKGRARVIKGPDDLDCVVAGEIVVLPESHPMYSIAVMKAAGLICQNGGRLSHICIVAMEMGIPCVTQVHEATKVISDGQYVLIAADEGEIHIDG